MCCRYGSNVWEVLQVRFLRFSLSSADSAYAECLGRDSSDEEKEKQKAEVTSVDEALRTVTGPADRSQEDFLRQNFETLAESSSIGRRGQTLSLSLCVTCSEFSNFNTFSFLFSIFPPYDLRASTAEESRVPRLSMSSRFLARGHNNRYCYC